MIINDADESVDNQVNQRLFELWQKQCPNQAHCFHFPAELGIPQIWARATSEKPRLSV